MRLRIFAAVFASVVMIALASHLNAAQLKSATEKAAPADAQQGGAAQAKAAPTGGSQSENPTKKLGAFVGKWETEGAFTSGQKTSTTLECRWSSQGSYLVCDQLVRMGAASDQRQLTVYSYDSKAGKYSFVTISDPGAKPTSSGITIKGNLWTYDDSSFTADGKTTVIRVTNEFTDPKTEVFKVTSSEDNGANWKTVLQGVAHKVAD
jgi:uncharacterized protein YxeA